MRIPCAWQCCSFEYDFSFIVFHGSAMRDKMKLLYYIMWIKELVYIDGHEVIKGYSLYRRWIIHDQLIWIELSSDGSENIQTDIRKHREAIKKCSGDLECACVWLSFSSLNMEICEIGKFGKFGNSGNSEIRKFGKFGKCEIQEMWKFGKLWNPRKFKNLERWVRAIYRIHIILWKRSTFAWSCLLCRTYSCFGKSCTSSARKR